jgi:hypothetical protein
MKTQKTDYFGVSEVKNPSSKWANKRYQGSFYNQKTGRHSFKYFDNMRDAAKWVDLQLIRVGKDPVNVLIRLNGERATDTGKEDQGARI